MVYGVLRLINFAHGDVYMVGAMTGYYAAHALGFAAHPSLAGLLVTLAASMVACGALGAADRARRLPAAAPRGAGRLAPLITAIGVSLLLENAGQLVFGADPKFFPPLHRVARAAARRRRRDLEHPGRRARRRRSC